uniref:Ribitol-5-phosphate transferase FKTN N-terminal domain-containing protein n=1 Tax=Clastoptera arizonana TaxID=38151 RepID=A0A1B6D8Y6_9HEMI
MILRSGFIKRISFRTLKSKSYMPFCLYVGLLSLFLQVLIFLSILFLLDEDFEWKLFSRVSQSIKNTTEVHTHQLKKLKDLKFVLGILFNLGIKAIVLNKYILFKENQTNSGSNVISKCIICNDFGDTDIVLGISSIEINNKTGNRMVEEMENYKFVVETFYNSKPIQYISELAGRQIAYIFKKTLLFHLVILHPREDNVWWYGDIHSDLNSLNKLHTFGLQYKDLHLMKHEGLLERFELIPHTIEKDKFIYFPKAIPKFIDSLENSRFVECNKTRADIFYKQYQPDRSPVATKFRHRAWKLLARTKTILDSLRITFWLSSGTCLGYYRECNIIAHSKDVDLGLWADDYTPKIITEMKKHGSNLKIWLGRPNDSLELSFIDQMGIKLDMFFFL